MKTACAMLAIVLAGSAFADTIHLNNGAQLDGVIKRDTGGWTITDESGKTRFVPDADVKRIQKGTAPTPQAEAQARVTALRRSLEKTTDPTVAIERYQAFIEQNKDNPAAEIALQDLRQWKDRKDQGLTRLGDKWLTPQELAIAMKGTIEKVDQARTLIREGRLKEAEALVDQFLETQKDNISALYLKAVLAYQQDQLGVAKKHLELVRESAPDHAPTLNNLAAILYQQKQYMPAITLYEQAMNASPRNRVILDNVIEALNALSESHRRSPIARRVEKKVIEQDTELQAQLESEGLYRWGSSYITREKMAEVKKAQDAIEQKIAQLKADYDKITDRIRSMENQIKANERTLESMVPSHRYTDPGTGDLVLVPASPGYYQLKRDNDKLKLDREDLIDKLDTFREKVDAVRAQTPLPQFTGRQKIIEAEGTPLAPSK